MYKENIFKMSSEERQNLLNGLSENDRELFDIHDHIQQADVEIELAVDWVITKLGEFIGSYDFIEENSLPDAPWGEMLRLLFRIRLSCQYIEESLDEMWECFKKHHENENVNRRKNNMNEKIKNPAPIAEKQNKISTPTNSVGF